MSADDCDRVEAKHARSHERLAALERRSDPRTLFRMNQNIAP